MTSDLIEQWRVDREKPGLGHLGPSLDRYYTLLGSFEAAGYDLLTATTEDIVAWTDARPGKNGQGLQPSGRRALYYVFANFYRWATEAQRRTDDPTPNIVDVTRDPRGVVTTAQVDAAFQAALTPRERCWIALMAFEGFKAIEIERLQATDFQLSSTPPTRRARPGDPTSEQLVPLHWRTVETLRELPDLPPSGKLFPGWTNQKISRALMDVAASVTPRITADFLTTYYGSISQQLDYPRRSEARPPTFSEAKRERLPFKWLVDQTLWPSEELEELVDALTTFRQVLLAGPPGTGKTWVAEQIAKYLTGGDDNAVQLVQFHPSYGYEEFIEGLRPGVIDATMTFERVDGQLLRFIRRRSTSKDMSVLIIDEMNRANLPRVFGELLFALEYRDQPIDLMYSRSFRLPEDLVMVGTMNTADRSIRSIDTAFRRRFEVFECGPRTSVLERWYERHELAVPDLLDGFRRLNDDLEIQLGRHYLIGHTFLMREEMTPAVLRRIWNRQIHPLIEEYFFDEPETAMRFNLEGYWPSTRRED